MGAVCDVVFEHSPKESEAEVASGQIQINKRGLKRTRNKME